LRRIQNLSHFVLANSEAVRQFLVKEDGFQPGKIKVIRNAVDFERFASVPRDRAKFFPALGPGHKLIGMVANMNLPVKGHSYLIEAARAVCRILPGTRFVLIGDGRQRPKLEQQVRELGLEQNFLFLGYHKDVPELLPCFDVSVLPSTAEGLPNVVLEAMAAGIPVVATAVGGTVEILEDGVCGLLVPPRDPEALAKAILRILQEPSLAEQLARAGQERVRAYFNFDRLLLELKELYEEPRHRESAKQLRRRAKETGSWESRPDPAAVGLDMLEIESAKTCLPSEGVKDR